MLSINKRPMISSFGSGGASGFIATSAAGAGIQSDRVKVLGSFREKQRGTGQRVHVNSGYTVERVDVRPWIIQLSQSSATICRSW